MSDDSLEGEGCSENRNAIWKNYNWLKIQDSTSLKNENEKPVSGLLPVQFVSPRYVCIAGLQHKAEWMSFLTELSTWLNHSAAFKNL